MDKADGRSCSGDKQHTTARTLVKRWMYDKRYVYAFELARAYEGILSVRPKDVAFLREFYSDDVERFLDRKVENPMGMLWDKLTHETIGDLNVDERVDVARYILIQCVRTPMMRERVRQDYLRRRARFAREAWITNDGSYELDSRRAIWLPSSFYETEARFGMVEDDASWFAALEPDGSYESFARRMAASRWTLIKAPEGSEFICSDAPVILRDRSLMDGAMGHFYSMSIGPRWLLELGDGLQAGRVHREIAASAVVRLNAMLSVQSTAIYGRDKELLRRYIAVVGRKGVIFDGEKFMPVGIEEDEFYED